MLWPAAAVGQRGRRNCRRSIAGRVVLRREFRTGRRKRVSKQNLVERIACPDWRAPDSMVVSREDYKLFVVRWMMKADPDAPASRTAECFPISFQRQCPSLQTFRTRGTGLVRLEQPDAEFADGARPLSARRR